MLRGVLALSAILAGGGAAWLWLLPVEVFQQSALTQAGGDKYARFEALGRTEAYVWLGRIALPVLMFAAAAGAVRAASLRGRILTVCGELSAITAIDPGEQAGRRPAGVSGVLRGLIVVWLGLFAAHAVEGVQERARDWAYFQLRSGEEVLPNISLENRDVIRYLQAATPEEARIFCYSDQKLYFLSYYLRPRRLFARIHPDAAYVIPRPGNEHPLRAYRPGEIPAEEVLQSAPDYILEYFQGPEYVDPARLTEDEEWVRFWRRSHRSSGIPPYLVVLRAIDAGDLP